MLARRRTHAPLLVLGAAVLLAGAALSRRPRALAECDRFTDAYALAYAWSMSEHEDELSGAALLPPRGGSGATHLLCVNNDPSALVVYELRPDASPLRLRSISLEGFFDTEAVAVRATTDRGVALAITEEKDRRIVLIPELPWEELLRPVPLADRTAALSTLYRADAAAVIELEEFLGPHDPSTDNKGLEGLAYDAVGGAFIGAMEKAPMGLLRVDAESGAIAPLFDAQAALRGIVTDIAGVAVEQNLRVLVVLSEESKALVALGMDGTVRGIMPIEAPQPEGVAVTADLRSIFVISERHIIKRYDRRPERDACPRR
jgi:uncharacterized protein YjiK